MFWGFPFESFKFGTTFYLRTSLQLSATNFSGLGKFHGVWITCEELGYNLLLYPLIQALLSSSHFIRPDFAFHKEVQHQKRICQLLTSSGPSASQEAGPTPDSLAVLYLASFLDRTNVGNAKVDGLQQALHMTNGQYNASLTIFFVSYSVFEPVTNVLLKRTRPSIFTPTIIVLWVSAFI